MGVIVDLLTRLCHWAKQVINIPDKLEILEGIATANKGSIRAMQGGIQTLSSNLMNLDKNGSEGATRKMDELHTKVDKLDEKLGEVVTLHGERLSRLEGKVFNGNGTN